jgi:hypothetical protein
MSDWLDEEVTRIKDDETIRQRKLEKTKTIGSQSAGFWDDFRYLIEQAVTKLNATPEIRGKIGETAFNGNNVDILRVENIAFPAVYLTITNQHSGIRVERVVRTNGGIPEPKEKRESEQLQFDLDNKGRIVLKTQDDRSFSVHDSVRYVLQPLVRKHESQERRV